MSFVICALYVPIIPHKPIPHTHLTYEHHTFEHTFLPVTVTHELQLHEFSGDVEDICDASAKELKIENTVTTIADRWKSIDWLMDLYADSDVPLLKIGEEDFEALEADQLTVQVRDYPFLYLYYHLLLCIKPGPALSSSPCQVPNHYHAYIHTNNDIPLYFLRRINYTTGHACISLR